LRVSPLLHFHFIAKADLGDWKVGKSEQILKAAIDRRDVTDHRRSWDKLVDLSDFELFGEESEADDGHHKLDKSEEDVTEKSGINRFQIIGNAPPSSWKLSV
jgi:hypothetical protein